MAWAGPGRVDQKNCDGLGQAGLSLADKFENLMGRTGPSLENLKM